MKPKNFNLRLSQVARKTAAAIIPSSYIDTELHNCVAAALEKFGQVVREIAREDILAGPEER